MEIPLEYGAKGIVLIVITLPALLSAVLVTEIASPAQDPQPTVIPVIQAQLSHI